LRRAATWRVTKTSFETRWLRKTGLATSPLWVAVTSAKTRKRQKSQAPTLQTPVRNRQTRKVANAKVLNRSTNLTYPNLT